MKSLPIAGSQWVQKLLTPHPSIKDLERQRAARSLLGIAITLVFTSIVSSVAMLLVMRSLSPIAPTTITIFVATYLLGRSSKPYLGSALLVISLNLVSILFIPISDAPVMGLFWLIVPIVLASILLPVWGTALLIALNHALVFVLGNTLSAITPQDSLRTILIIFFISMLSLFHQITKSGAIKKVEQQSRDLQLSQARYASLFNDIPIGLYQTTPAGQIVDANPALLELLGYEHKEDLINASAITHYSDQSTRQAWRTALEKHGVLLNYVTQLQRADGEALWVRESTRIYNENGNTFYRGSLEDITEQHRAEQELIERRHTLNMVITSMPNALFIITPNKTLASAHVPPQFPLVFKQMPQRDTHISDIFPADMAARIIAVIESCDSNSSDCSFECSLQSDTDDPVFVQVRITSVSDSHNQLLVIDDVTDQKRAEIALKEAKDRAEQFNRVVPSAIFTVDVDGHVTSLNNKAAEIIGYAPEEVLGKHCSLFAIEPCNKMCGAFASSISKPIHGRECVVKTSSGELRTVSKNVELIHDSEGNIIGAIESFEDITERKRAEQEVQAQRDFAQQVMNTMGQGLLVVDRQLKIDYFNPAITTLIANSTESIIGKTLLDFAVKDSKQQVEYTFSRALEGHYAVNEIHLSQGEGASVPVLITVVPRRRAGEIVGAIAVITDLTAQKQVEHALAEARDRAIDASQQKSDFLANMSHEIRTPLNAVIGMTSLLLDTELSTEQMEFVNTVRVSGDSLLILINDILDFSKIEAGKLELEEQPFEIRACVEAALDVLAQKARHKHLDMAYYIEEDVPTAVIGDVTRLRQVLVNLLGNAVKFTEQGEIYVHVSCKQQQTAPDEDQSSGQYELTFAVRDTGIGIPEERRDRLFKAFSQVDASTTRKYGGTGLGLAISQRLTGLMGGRIWVESKVDEGSTFSFTMTTSAAVSKLRNRQALDDQLDGLRVLIVDDNATNRLILSKYVESWKMNYHAANDGLAALNLLKNGGEEFDIALLDMQMPGMDGVELAQEIRQHRETRNLPLIMISSLGHSLEKPDSDLFQAFLGKPIKPSRLYDSLVSIITDRPVKPVVTQRKIELDPELGKHHPLRILVAEDNVVNQKVIFRMLERMGYRADIAANGLEVLEALGRQEYDVILMDVQMPEMDGVEASERIRHEWPAETQPRIIAATAHALTGDRERLLEAGMDDYISKPVQIEELVAVLERSQPLAVG